MSDRVMVDQVYGAAMTRDFKRWGVAALWLALASMLTAACSEAKAACDDAFAEKIDSNSSIHVRPGVKEPTYKTNPPTSGAHRTGGIDAGVSDAPIDKPTQVNILESGDVLVQYRRLSGDQLEDVRSLAGERVVVAPNNSLKNPIVMTAWRNKMECSRFDATLMGEFIDEHADKRDGH